jgi:hypothetical protein
MTLQVNKSSVSSLLVSLSSPVSSPSTFMEQLALYSDSDDDQGSTLQTTPSRSYPAAAAAVSVASNAANSEMSGSKRCPTLTKETDVYFATDAISGNQETVTRFKCPGCERTYEQSSGVMNHLKNPGHAAVDGPITQDRTRVLCKRIDGKFVAMAPTPVPIPPILQSLTQVYAIECGFLFEY